jgi:hypothetical protein
VALAHYLLNEHSRNWEDVIVDVLGFGWIGIE